MITKKPVDNSKFKKNIVLTNTARIAFKHILKTIYKENNERLILLPSYIGITDREGSGVFDPIQEVGVNYDFYKLNDKLSIDFEYLQVKLKKTKVKALLVVHYFGFAQNDMDYVSNYCKANDIILIEDCAHLYNSYFNGKLLGSFGDFSFFSIHKFLSTKDGGILRQNNEKFIIEEIPHNEKIKLNTLEVLYKADIDKISELRCRNYNQLFDKIRDITWLSPMYDKLPDGIVPMNLPVLIDSKREFIYFELMKRNMPTISLYYRLIDEISKVEFPEMFNISNNILNLPVHQEIELEDINTLSKVLREINIYNN